MRVDAECQQQHCGGMREHGNENRCQKTAGRRSHRLVAPLAVF
jgi:hypothetical protein